MSKAFVKTIHAHGHDGIHSVSPHWVLTFIRWNNRYLNLPNAKLTPEDQAYFLSTRNPLVVENDCASLSVHYSKESHTPSMQAMLYAGDINYSTAIATGDFVLVNMLDFPEDARRVGDAARNSQQINNPEDGFKGVFKVQSVRRKLGIDPASGAKRVMFQITGFAFTELNNTIYFNPFLLSSQEASNQFMFVTRISEVWEKFVSKKGTFKVQDILRLLIDSTIGIGFNKAATDKKGFNVTENTHFYIPDKVGTLLGLQGAKSAKDIYNYLLGVQAYQAPSSDTATLQQGMNPKISKTIGRYYITPIACQGTSFLKPEYWNQVSVWSILNQYTNAPINELFTTLRISPEGSVMPTVVFRQIPFSSETYSGLATKFMTLPRWKIAPELLTDIDIGRDETARINFVQVFASVPQASQQSNQGYISQQIAAKNYVTDKLDIRRSGLKPYIITSNFDTITTDKAAFNAPVWAKLLADSVIGGHLKLNGSITTAGIVEPVAVGDNLELDGIVFHIESISHNCSIQPDGKRSFETHFELSHGVDVRSEKGDKIFGQMDNVDMELEIENDQKTYDGNLPGTSDEQEIVSRPVKFGENNTINSPFPSVPGSPPSKSQNNTTPKQSKKRSKK